MPGPVQYNASYGAVIQILQGQTVFVTATDKTGNASAGGVSTLPPGVIDVGLPSVPTLTLALMSASD
jgi:hypothetical protein